MKRKGFTLMELLIVVAISNLVLTMIYSTYNTIKNGMAKKKAQVLGEQFIDEVVQGMTRSYASATSIKGSGTTSLLLTANGYITKSIVNTDDFQRGFSDISAVFGTNDTEIVSGFNKVLILLLFKFENPFDSSGTYDFYRALGISNVDANNIPTKESNFVSLEYHSYLGFTGLKTKQFTAKAPRLYIKKVEIRPDTTNDRILHCSIGVRTYLHRAKHIEDAGHFDVYNHGTIRKFTFTIKK